MPGGQFVNIPPATRRNVSQSREYCRCGSAGTVQLDAHTAIMTLLEFLYISFPFGIATSATIRVGNLVGAGRPHEARIAGDRSGGLPVTCISRASSRVQTSMLKALGFLSAQGVGAK